MTDDVLLLKDRKITKQWVAIATGLYGALFPFLFYSSLYSATSLLEAAGRILMGLILVFFCFSIPLSIPVSIYFMWRRYCQAEYRKARLFCLSPLIATATSYAVIEVISRLVI